MDTIIMIIRSHIKQKQRSVLILIQLSIAFFATSIGLGMLEATLIHLSQVKSVVSSKVINLTPLGDVSLPLSKEKNKFIEFYNDMKNDERIYSMGSKLSGYIKSDQSDRPDEKYRNFEVITLDNDLIPILNNGNNLKATNSGKGSDSTIPVLVGRNVIKTLFLGSEKKIRLSNSTEYSISVQGVVNKNTLFFDGSKGMLITEGLINLDNSIVVILPKKEKPLFSKTGDMNLLIKLKNDEDRSSFISDVQQKFKKYNINSDIHDINYETNQYIQRNKITIISSIGISIVILMLSSFGIVAVILSSILKRKTEFGIRYSIGASPKNIMTLIVGEVLIMFLLGDILGNIFAFAVSMAITEIKIGYFTILSSALVMFVFSFLSSLVPAVKIINMEPIKLIHRERV